MSLQPSFHTFFSMVLLSLPPAFPACYLFPSYFFFSPICIPSKEKLGRIRLIFTIFFLCSFPFSCLSSFLPLPFLCFPFSHLHSFLRKAKKNKVRNSTLTHLKRDCWNVWYCYVCMKHEMHFGKFIVFTSSFNVFWMSFMWNDIIT